MRMYLHGEKLRKCVLLRSPMVMVVARSLVGCAEEILLRGWSRFESDVTNDLGSDPLVQWDELQYVVYAKKRRTRRQKWKRGGDGRKKKLERQAARRS